MVERTVSKSLVGGREATNTSHSLPTPLAHAVPSRVQELKAAIQQTEAARYLKQMRPRKAPLPGVPQLAPKRIILLGDYARPKRMVEKSKVGSGRCPKSKLALES